MLAGVWPYVAANWPTDRKFVTPPATAAFRCARFRSRMMNDTVSGVSGGVSPKAVAPGSAATSVPCCTGTWELGLGLGLGVAARGDAEAAGAMIIIVASAAPVSRLRWKERVMKRAPLSALPGPRLGNSCTARPPLREIGSGSLSEEAGGFGEAGGHISATMRRPGRLGHQIRVRVGETRIRCG